MRKSALALSIALLATACTAAPEAQAPIEPQAAAAKAVAPAPAPPGAGFIESIEYVGTGCAKDSTATGLSPDRQAVTSIFSSFIASAGPGTPPADASKNCLMIFQINVPEGWQYSLESVHHRGFAGLERDVTASRRSLYLISGSPAHVTPPAHWQGETSDDYTHEDVGPDNGVWSPCGGGQVLYVATQTEVDTGGRGGLLAVDTIDTELQWKTCPKP
jgi:Domain of unknown function (DUF4360)